MILCDPPDGSDQSRNANDLRKEPEKKKNKRIEI